MRVFRVVWLFRVFRLVVQVVWVALSVCSVCLEVFRLVFQMRSGCLGWFFSGLFRVFMLAVPNVWAVSVVEVVPSVEVGCPWCLGWLFRVFRLVVQGL